MRENLQRLKTMRVWPLVQNTVYWSFNSGFNTTIVAKIPRIPPESLCLTPEATVCVCVTDYAQTMLLFFTLTALI